METVKNVLGETLQTCCNQPSTGFYRTGRCETGTQDFGSHVVCSEVTEDFLSFTKQHGNDLSTPSPWAGFPGLKPGDNWCLCATRWKEAMDASVAPPVILLATHEAALKFVSMDDFSRHNIDFL